MRRSEARSREGSDQAVDVEQDGSNPWFYVMGLGVAAFAIYDVITYARLSKKPERLENGKKPIW